jgi:ABC-type phosphate/phosphonate transport system substrate-binding protein
MIANARMYALNDAVAGAWRRLFAWIALHADVPLQVMDHAAPAPLTELWRRPDLGCAMMCGYPWATWNDADAPRPAPLAVPIPSPARFGATPHYWSDIVVPADSRISSERELAGTRLVFTTVDSQSGYQAPRAYFSAHALAAGGRLFGTTIGPVVTPRRVVDNLLTGAADAGPLDAWWHDLLRHHEPAVAARLRVIARTPSTPMPFFAASKTMVQDVKTRLIAAFDAVATTAELAETRETLQLLGFARVDPADYSSLAERAREIDALGYTRLQ